MRLFGKVGVRFLVAFFAVAYLVISVAADDEQEDDKKEDDVINVPIPVGEDAMGLRIPLYDQMGNLTMSLEVDRAQKIDESRMLMVHALVETFTKKKNLELRIAIPESVIDLRTSIVTSKSPVTIERDDFSLTGDGMEFHLKSKKGRVIGNVKMLIYNRDNFSPEQSAQ